MIQEIEQLKKAGTWFKKLWAASLGIVLALVLGFSAGVLYTEGQIIDDCRFSGVFRIGIQSYNCVRRQ